MTDSKACTKCGKTKPLIDYYKNKLTKDGRQNSCIVCSRAKQRLYGLKKRKGTPVMANESFSTIRHCDVCDEDKHWKQYHIEVGMCAACYRVALSTNEPAYRHHSSTKMPTIDDLLAAIDVAADKAAKKEAKRTK